MISTRSLANKAAGPLFLVSTGVGCGVLIVVAFTLSAVRVVLCATSDGRPSMAVDVSTVFCRCSWFLVCYSGIGLGARSGFRTRVGFFEVLVADFKRLRRTGGS